MDKVTLIQSISEVEFRFWKKVKILENGCWEWQAALSENGYGLFSYKGKTVIAHRLAWYFITGEWLPPEIMLRHKVCNNSKCVNPDHLVPGTNQENSDDKYEAGRAKPRAGMKYRRREIGEIVRREYAQGKISQKKLAEKYDYSLRGIQYLLRP